MNIQHSGSIKELKAFERFYRKKNIFLITGKSSFAQSGAEEIISEILKFENVTHFNNFTINPKIEDAVSGAKLARETKTELIIAIGGGSVIDIAKLVKAFCFNTGKEIDLTKGKETLNDPEIDLIAIPTTAGSGSEATDFAVAYIDKNKYSLASKFLLPNLVVLDASLIASNSKYQKACNGLDALAQAIESTWAFNTSKKSQEISLSAISLCIECLPKLVNEKFNLNIAKKMMHAANLAGQSIRITKTTAAHAWSYGFTSTLNIPHGHAVWLTLPKIFQIHSSPSVLAENEELKQTIEHIRFCLGMNKSDQPREFLTKFCSSLGIDLDFHLIKDCNQENLNLFSKAVNAERMSNNPINFTQQQINYIFEY